MAHPLEAAPADDAIGAYKAVLANVIEQRPSGMRQRLADALGKHRSFVTQISSPAYSTPIPSKHLPLIFAVCHFSAAEREQFLGHYRRAHPGKAPGPSALRKTRHLSLTVPDLEDEKLNAALDRAIHDFVNRITAITGKGGS
ncbi:MAG: hypothetical protein JNL61_06140 [Rhizobiaceae bacterium]|nr:hypothetical protein [Rhizobiaceae bacterium]